MTVVAMTAGSLIECGRDLAAATTGTSVDAASFAVTPYTLALLAVLPLLTQEAPLECKTLVISNLMVLAAAAATTKAIAAAAFEAGSAEHCHWGDGLRCIERWCCNQS